jgi:hypothetical protein
MALILMLIEWPRQRKIPSWTASVPAPALVEMQRRGFVRAAFFILPRLPAAAIDRGVDAAYISALAALSGSIIGGLTSLGASWLTQNAQARTQQLLDDKGRRRQELYKAFIEEALRLYGEALVSDDAEVSKFVALHVMLSRMRVLSSQPVVENAEKVIHLIAETFFEPNKTLRDLRGKGEKVDILRHFSEACREDLQRRAVT